MKSGILLHSFTRCTSSQSRKEKVSRLTYRIYDTINSFPYSPTEARIPHCFSYSDIAQRHEALKLHKHIQAYFVEAMDKLYLREISSAEWSDRTLASSAGNHGGKNDNTLGDSASHRPAIGAPGSERAMMTAVDVQSTVLWMVALPAGLGFFLSAW